jgi:subtilase family serine protease
MKSHRPACPIRPCRGRLAVALLSALAALGATSLARARLPGSTAAAVRISQPIDESRLVSAGSAPRWALKQFDRGEVADSLPMEHMFVQLQRSAQQQAQLEQLQDPNSANYHQWLSADEFGERFGPASSDIDTVTQWLGSHGLKVNQVFKGAVTIDVSGTAGQVRETFHTEIHAYEVDGKQHIANASAPQIPAALAGVVAGVVSLNDFMPKPLVVRPKSNLTFNCAGCPDGFNDLELCLEAPGDFATIYNVAPLYQGKHPTTGKGQTVVVLEDSDAQPADVTSFRAAFGLASYAGTFTQIHPGSGCSDPGVNADEIEAALDAEWAGAIAPDAVVELASCANSSTNFGGFIAAQNLLDRQNSPPIMSLSYGSCEAEIGPGLNGNGFINGLWQQAAVEGVSVFVSSGDSGPAGCDDPATEAYAIAGVSASGFGSTPYNVAVGGTDFLDTAENANSTYWKSTNTSTGRSAKSYVPEMTWNDSCASSVFLSIRRLPGRPELLQ